MEAFREKRGRGNRRSEGRRGAGWDWSLMRRDKDSPLIVDLLKSVKPNSGLSLLLAKG